MILISSKYKVANCFRPRELGGAVLCFVTVYVVAKSRTSSLSAIFERTEVMAKV